MFPVAKATLPYTLLMLLMGGGGGSSQARILQAIMGAHKRISSV